MRRVPDLTKVNAPKLMTYSIAARRTDGVVFAVRSGRSPAGNHAKIGLASAVTANVQGVKQPPDKLPQPTPEGILAPSAARSGAGAAELGRQAASSRSVWLADCIQSEVVEKRSPEKCPIWTVSGISTCKGN